MNSQERSYTIKKKSKLIQGILLGALAGAAISMLDRYTRESAIECGKKGYYGAREVISNPDQIISQVKETSNKIRSTIESISEDVAFITNQVEVLKELPPQVTSVVKDTKEAFVDDVQKEESIL